MRVVPDRPARIVSAGIKRQKKPPANRALCTPKNSAVPNENPDTDFDSRLRITDITMLADRAHTIIKFISPQLLL